MCARVFSVREFIQAPWLIAARTSGARLFGLALLIEAVCNAPHLASEI